MAQSPRKKTVVAAKKTVTTVQRRVSGMALGGGQAAPRRGPGGAAGKAPRKSTGGKTRREFNPLAANWASRQARGFGRRRKLPWRPRDAIRIEGRGGGHVDRPRRSQGAQSGAKAVPSTHMCSTIDAHLCRFLQPVKSHRRLSPPRENRTDSDRVRSRSERSDTFRRRPTCCCDDYPLRDWRVSSHCGCRKTARARWNLTRRPSLLAGARDCDGIL